MAEQPDLITLGEAVKRLGIARHTFRKRLRDWGVTVYTDPKRTNYKLVSWDDVQRAYAARLVPTNGKEAPHD